MICFTRTNTQKVVIEKGLNSIRLTRCCRVQEECRLRKIHWFDEQEAIVVSRMVEQELRYRGKVMGGRNRHGRNWWRQPIRKHLASPERIVSERAIRARLMGVITSKTTSKTKWKNTVEPESEDSTRVPQRWFFEENGKTGKGRDNRGKGQLSEGHLFNSLECTDVSFAALIPK